MYSANLPRWAVFKNSVFWCFLQVHLLFCMMGIKNISNLSSSKIPLTCRLSCFSDLHGAGWTTPVLRLPGPCDLSRWQAVKTIELNKTLQLCWRVKVFPGEKGFIDNYCTFFPFFRGRKWQRRCIQKNSFSVFSPCTVFFSSIPPHFRQWHLADSDMVQGLINLLVSHYVHNCIYICTSTYMYCIYCPWIVSKQTWLFDFYRRWTTETPISVGGEVGPSHMQNLTSTTPDRRHLKVFGTQIHDHPKGKAILKYLLPIYQDDCGWPSAGPPLSASELKTPFQTHFATLFIWHDLLKKK